MCRFGSGLVIYWYGFVDALDCQRHHGIAVGEGLPKTVDRVDMKLWEENPEWEVPQVQHWDPAEC